QLRGTWSEPILYGTVVFGQCRLSSSLLGGRFDEAVMKLGDDRVVLGPSETPLESRDYIRHGHMSRTVSVQPEGGARPRLLVCTDEAIHRARHRGGEPRFRGRIAFPILPHTFQEL